MTTLYQKLTIVGDSRCGKTSLLIVFADGNFPELDVPSWFSSCITVDVDGQPAAAMLSLFDTFCAPGVERDRGCPLGYPKTDVFLLCFAVDDHNSLRNVRDKWMPEISHFCLGVPVLLVACKTDLRDALNATEEKPMYASDSKRGPFAIGIRVHYVECSAKLGEGVTEVFHNAAAACLRAERARHHRRLCAVV
ncbi:small GTPase-binding protein [Mycena maculata]|uniref:Small GTPase-binding protein n=1 Tax=Mycena maculata TaxID=230809 RepID=A0AAD7NWA4_9AGAR|nr:small GTPase-binding protein [Mycena maculata]